MPARKSISEARILAAVVTASPRTISVLGTYLRLKTPRMPITRYSSPARRASRFVGCIALSFLHGPPWLTGPLAARHAGDPEQGRSDHEDERYGEEVRIAPRLREQLGLTRVERQRGDHQRHTH